ncbi:hypothetical protein I4U23_015036 [Adineta vaga]|nr:hypothetical protein I4U23_015036 [Adineta vaga]
MKQTKKIFLSRPSDYSTGGGGGFGFTLRHYVTYPPTTSINHILQASYSVVIDEHQQKQLEDDESITMRIPSPSTSLRHHQGEQQGISSSNSMKIISTDNIDDDDGITRHENLQYLDTIFVKDVRRNSPAYKAGLRQGDRILSVNDQSIYGKTYAQVIAIIQNTPYDLVLNVLPKEDDLTSLNSYQSILSTNYSSPTIMSNNTIEQKLRNLKINLAQGRTQEELAQAGIYFPSPKSSSPQNLFSNYIESVHKALDSSSKQSTNEPSASYFQSPFHNEYIPYDYKQSSSFLPIVNSSFNLPSQDQTQWTSPSSSSRDEIKSPSTDSMTTEKDMKTEFVNFRKKQFETGHVENLVKDNQHDSKVKKYSENKKYENEWNRLTATTDVESVMTRASHFEDIDPNKFVKFKSKSSNSPTSLEQENVLYHEDDHPEQINYYESQYKLMKPVVTSFNSTSSYQVPMADEINHIDYNYNHPRYMIEPMQTMSSKKPSSTTTTTTTTSHYVPLTTNESQRYTINNYSNNSPPSVNLIRQDSYITAVRSAYSNEQADFVNMHVCDPFALPCNPETPILRHKVSQYGVTPRTNEQDMKQRRTSYLIATDQRLSNRREYLPSEYLRTNKDENYSYDNHHEQHQQQQKLRNTPQQQTQAIKKLKSFFGEGTPELTHALDRRSSLSPQSSSGNQSKSGSYFDSSTTTPQESISLTTMADNIEASKEGILYCKTVLKDGRRAIDRSWRGAWAVLRRGALFLGKEKKHGLLIPLSCDSFPINLQNAEVELASDYVKKPRVFKLSTPNQSEFLFQAPDVQSLSEWLYVIKDHCVLEQDNPQLMTDIKEKALRKSASSIAAIASTNEQDLLSQNDTQHKLSPTQTRKSKLSLRSPSLKRSPSLRFRKSQKSTSIQPLSSVNNLNSPISISPRRSFVKSIVKKGLRTLKSSSSILTNQMSGQIYDESSGEYVSSSSGVQSLSQGRNFGIELEECESSSISRHIPIVVEILTRLVELRGVTCQGIYRHAGGLTAVNWLVSEFDKGAERIDFNSEKWYDVKAIASTLKTFFAKLPDSLLSSKMSSLSVEASRIENHRNRLMELKRLIMQLDDYRFETLKYLCAHFRRVASKCNVNKIDARNLAIIFGPTLIWDSKASLQSNLVDNPEKIRIIESFILYYEWFFDYNDYDEIPGEINPQMPKLPSVLSINPNDHELSLNNETKPSEIIQQIVRAARRRWSSPLLLDSLSSLSVNNTDQQTSKPINISVKRNRRRDTKKEEKSSSSSSRSRSVDSSLQTNQIVSSSTDSAVYSMSDVSSSISTATTTKKPSQSLRDISQLFHYFTLSNDKHKSKTLTNIRRKKSRKKVTDETFLLPTNKDDEIYERISNSSICFIDQSPVREIDLVEQTSLLKSKLLEHENLLHTLKQQIHEVDQQIFIIKEDSIQTTFFSSSDRQLIKRRHTFNSLLDLNDLFLEKNKISSSSLYALQLL